MKKTTTAKTIFKEMLNVSDQITKITERHLAMLEGVWTRKSNLQLATTPKLPLPH